MVPCVAGPAGARPRLLHIQRMLGFATVFFAILCVGFASFELLRKWLRSSEPDDFEPLEIASASALLGGSLWIAANWILALTHHLTRVALTSVAVAFGLVAVIVVSRAFPRLQTHVVARSTAIQLALGVPLLLWCAFALWRGAVLPPLSHDVLGYHLPKAVFMMRAHGFEYFPAIDLRISNLPANYELLLADVLLMSGSDRLTEWIGTATFVLFLAAVGAVAQRWWRKGAIPAMLAAATAPVLILHSSADKNDLMIGFLAVCALLWGARWAARGGSLSLVLLTTALTTGAGTKPQQAAVLVGLLPFLLWRALVMVRGDRRVMLRLAAIALAAVAWFCLTGGAAYIANALHDSTPMDVQIGGEASAANAPASLFEWGDWNNLWQFPFLLVTVPFSKNPFAVWVPWRGEYWYWPHYEIFFSHFGVLLSALIVATPFAIARLQRAEERERQSERMIYTIAALIAMAMTLPVRFRPLGFFGSFPRYLLFVLPLFICWTIAPTLGRLLESGAWRRKVGFAGVGILSMLFVFTAWRWTVRDTFAPLKYAMWAAANPGTRVVWFAQNRAGSVVDRMAGPDDTIAIDGSWDTWIYPAYGARLTRQVLFLPPPQPGRPVPVPDAAQWVIIDRSRNQIWGHPGLTDMGRFWRYVGRGEPLPIDLALYEQLARDPRFQLVYRELSTNQSIFWRRVPGQRAPKPSFIRFTR